MDEMWSSNRSKEVCSNVSTLVMVTTAAAVQYKIPLKMKRKCCVLGPEPDLTVVFAITNT